MNRRASLPLALLPALLVASVARADSYLPKDETFLFVGPLVSGSSRSSGLGVELSLNFIDGLTGVGPFAQAQLMDSEYVRLCAGAQLTFVVLGMELGVMHETGTRDHLPTTGLHFAPYLSFLYGSVGVRFGIPLAPQVESIQGVRRRTPHAGEVAFVMTLKLPFRKKRSGGLEPLL
ncbi:hypothetical protein HPC49_13005 [Pyxidicoccus fallax]|uniref:Uncharacterized protein n=1 Tax=Pyxidicoccus fallax TaxID=394095 RepID=A0A848LLT3_9BACT|nr:hypothetical protein [Pyxidicoccus fallax]NMO18613.1 hypothetical protein [Pyxidicoccus fallax]NPC79154.1 hypothetical protein [Pyxidicoccus fallax]